MQVTIINRGEYPVGNITKKQKGNKPGSGWINELGLIRGGKAYAFQPNSLYKVGHSYYQTDIACARVKEVRGYYVNYKADRGPHQTKVGNLSGIKGDVGGHLIRSANGGSGHAINMVPMANSINRSGGSWNKMEREIDSYIKDNPDKTICIEIYLHYDDETTLRPSKFTVKAFYLRRNTQISISPSFPKTINNF